MLRSPPVRAPDELVLVSMTRFFVGTNYALFEKFRNEAGQVADLTSIR